MARTLGMTRDKANRTKKREQPLGIAVVSGLATTLAVAIFIVAAQLLVPHSVMHNFYALVHYNASATLPLDPLYQNWAAIIQEDDVVETAFALLCGGFVLGRLAPSYVPMRRVLLSGLLMALGVLLVSLGFIWTSAVISQNTLNAHEGGQQVGIAAPPSLILVQTLLVVFWTALCVFGTWLGLALRERLRRRQAA